MTTQAERKEDRQTEWLLWELDADRLWRDIYDRGLLQLILGAQEAHARHHRAAFVDALAEVKELMQEPSRRAI